MKSSHSSSGIRLVAPFLCVMALLTVLSFIIPLRPTQSQIEKRNLAAFPDFTWDALVSGSYFDDITLWFSDTFPGREDWLRLSTSISSLHVIPASPRKKPPLPPLNPWRPARMRQRMPILS